MILLGLIQYTLDNVQMTPDKEPPYTHTMITKIYDLKPLWNVHSVPISFFSFLVLMFKPRNIRDSELKPWKSEKNLSGPTFSKRQGNPS
jgi:hypothetical protein